MGRVKQGLDYFPLSTNFIHNRIVRRVMKHGDDSAFTILIYVMSYLYSGEGYYARVDTDFCDELSDQLFSTDNNTVRHVIHLFLEYGFFDSTLYERYSILTPKDVQRQYLFVTKHRNRHHTCPDYCLLPEGETTDEQSNTVTATGGNVAVFPNIAATSRDTAIKTTLIERKERERRENILPNPPFARRRGEEEERSEGEKVAEGVGGGTREECDQRSITKRQNLTQEDIDRVRVPPGECPCNFSDLPENLQLFRVPPAEQYVIMLEGNYGEIDGGMWKGSSVIRGSDEKIKLPGHYLLSVLNK